MVIFDDEIIKNHETISQDMMTGLNEIKKRLNQSTTIDKQTKILFEYLGSVSLHMLSVLYRFSSFHMKLANNNQKIIQDVGDIIDKLPEEFHTLKKQLKNDIESIKGQTQKEIESKREAVTLDKDDYDFIRWEKRYREDEVKDKETDKDENT
jgi:hypothetical protein